MALNLKQRLEQKFEEEIRFFKGMVSQPKKVGAIVPTSSITAKKMASVINPHSGLPVLELGPGTGVITKAILARGIKPLHRLTPSTSMRRLANTRARCSTVSFPPCRC